MNESEDKIHLEALEEKNSKDKLCEKSEIKKEGQSITNSKDCISKIK